MARRMLIDATHPEETRVVVLNGNRLEEFDFETSTKKQIKGNIYLAKVTRVEPSLQAAFVEYGGNRHGFLAFSEIHPDYYRIPVGDREAMIAAERYDDEHGDDEPQPLAPHEHHEQPDHDAEGHDHDHGDHDHEHDHEAGEHSHEHALDAPPEPAPVAYPGPTLAASDGITVGATYAVEIVEPAPFESSSFEATPDAASSETGESDAARDEAAQGESDDGSSHIEQSEAAPITVETVGGDDFEEVQSRPRTRHYRSYKIQEVIKRRQILLIQVTKEERGNKGAALTTYLSLAGRYCVLMPNAGRGGGVSRKITSTTDRRRLKELMEELEVPEGMGVIVRTAGSERSKAEIKRDYEYLLRLWDEIREMTLQSSAPALIYEEGSLIKRAIRDLYARDIEEVQVEGEEGYRTAKEFMRMLMPSHAAKVRPYRDPAIPLFHRFQVDAQIDQIHNPVVQLRSGGYIVINPTEALVSIDVNSGRSTKERNIEETATKTNLEAAEEIARQLRLRDLAGLVVIDFIDMEDGRNQGAVERKLKDAMKNDRARIQLGRISPFGLLELSRQRLRSSLIEASTQVCPHCNGTGTIRSTESTALVVLRALEEEGIRRRTAEIAIYVPTQIALYVLNQKRDTLSIIEQRYGFRVMVLQDDTLVPPAFRLERVRALTPQELAALPVPVAVPVEEEEEEFYEEPLDEVAETEGETREAPAARGSEEGGSDEDRPRRKRRRRKRRRPGEEQGTAQDGDESAEGDEEDGDESEDAEVPAAAEGAEGEDTAAGEAPGEVIGADGLSDAERKRRRRGKRGGRRRRREDETGAPAVAPATNDAGFPAEEEDPIGYPAALDYARDGREHLFALPGEEDAAVPVAPVPVPTDLVPVEPAGAEVPAAETPEPVAEEKPKRRRAPRKKAAAAEAVVEAPAVAEPVVAEPVVIEPVEAVAEPTAEAAPAEKPKRRRAPARKKAEAVTPVEIAAETVTAETPAEPVEVTPAPEPVVVPPVVVEAPTAEAPKAETPPAEAGPPRRGWWKRLIE
jgi:ribonuclease E